MVFKQAGGNRKGGTRWSFQSGEKKKAPKLRGRKEQFTGPVVENSLAEGKSCRVRDGELC